MGLGALGKMQMRSREKNGRSLLASFPLHHPSNGTLGLAAFDDDTVDWLQTAAALCI